MQNTRIEGDKARPILLSIAGTKAVDFGPTESEGNQKTSRPLTILATLFTA
jgi:hypothetical protein